MLLGLAAGGMWWLSLGGESGTLYGLSGEKVSLTGPVGGGETGVLKVVSSGGGKEGMPSGAKGMACMVGSCRWEGGAL